MTTVAETTPVRGAASSNKSVSSAKTPGQTLPLEVVADLRTDHAGETGAVCIYQGVLFFARDPALRAFAQRHSVTEQAHLEQIEAWLPAVDRSRLLPVWRIAGWLTGAVPAMFGPRAVYGTIETVERFVDHHYEDQINRLEASPALHLLRQTLVECRSDEVEHRDEAAAARGAGKPGALQQVWNGLVSAGSRGAVAICRYI